MKSKTQLLVFVALSILTISQPVVAQQDSQSSEPWSYLNMPLQPRSETESSADSQSSFQAIPGFSESLVRMAGSLAVVLSLFLGILRMTRSRRPSKGIRLGKETLEVIGQTTLTKNHTLHVVKLGERLLLVSAGESDVTCLSEISDPVEVEQLLATTEIHDSPRSTFKTLFAQYDQNPNELFTNT